MNRLIISLGLLILIVGPGVVWADTDGHGRSVDDVIGDVLVGQGIDDTENVDCSKVSNEYFEELGDAVMQDMVGNNERHSMMDSMMGGEGSDSLREMHVHMGQHYLGCADGGSRSFGIGSMGMMSGGMNMMGGGSSMMGNISGLGNAMGLGGSRLVFWVLVIVVIGLLVAWLKRGQNAAGLSNKALGILKERYAKGEIDEREFETKKKGLI